jgi:hypothetical protein
MLPLRSDIDLMKADDNDNDNNDVLERKGWILVPKKNLHPDNYTHLYCTWQPMGASFCQLLCVVLSRAINHGATVPKESKVQKKGMNPLHSPGRVQKLNYFLCFQISLHIPEWKSRMTQNKLLMGGKFEFLFSSHLRKCSFISNIVGMLYMSHFLAKNDGFL